MEINAFFEWSTLGTLSGAAAAVSAVTQIIKNVRFLDKIPTQFLSYLIAIAVLIPATFFSGEPSPEKWAIIPINAILVSLSSNGIYSLAQRISGGDSQ